MDRSIQDPWCFHVRISTMNCALRAAPILNSSSSFHSPYNKSQFPPCPADKALHSGPRTFTQAICYLCLEHSWPVFSWITPVCTSNCSECLLSPLITIKSSRWSLESQSSIRLALCLGFQWTTRILSSPTGLGEHQSGDLGGSLKL